MKAIVLTYDNYRCLTEHMIHQYRLLWPGNPFIFHIPYQQFAGDDEPDRVYVHCPPGIKDTVLALLEGMDDQQWVYWSIDDKYPVTLDVRAMQSIFRWIQDVNDPSVDGVLCCRPLKLMKPKRLTGNRLQAGKGMTLLERKDYKCIWIHQFLRVGVLRYLFEAFPDEIPGAKAMDKLKNLIPKPADHRLFVTEHTLAVFGESTSRGVLTKNCYRSMKKLGLPLPDWHNGKTARTNLHGNMPERITSLLRSPVSNRVNRTS